MSQQELLRRVIRVLTENEIAYMLTGSLASSLQGEPRSTHDIDVVVTLQKESIQKLCEDFLPPEFYLDKSDIVEAVEKKGMFNLLNVSEGDKVDFWIMTNEPFDVSRFSRRVLESIMGVEVQISSPEDTIIAKLRWAELSGGSEKQFIDALRVYEVQYQNLDLKYLQHWINELQLSNLWTRLQSEAEIV